MTHNLMSIERIKRIGGGLTIVSNEEVLKKPSPLEIGGM